VTFVEPNGTKSTYRRLGNQEIGRLTVTDMRSGRQIILEGQRSMNDEFAGKIAEGVVNGLIRYGAGGL
jgi:hypothetical protein